LGIAKEAMRLLNTQGMCQGMCALGGRRGACESAETEFENKHPRDHAHSCHRWGQGASGNGRDREKVGERKTGGGLCVKCVSSCTSLN